MIKQRHTHVRPLPLLPCRPVYKGELYSCNNSRPVLTVGVQDGVGDTRGDQVLLSSPLPVEDVALAPALTTAYVVEEVLRVTAAC